MRRPLESIREEQDREPESRAGRSPSAAANGRRDFNPSIPVEQLENLREGRAIYRDQANGREYELNRRKLYAMAEVGRFRAIDTQDLGRHFYQGNQQLSQRDLNELRQQGLVEVNVARYSETMRVVTLSKEGERLLRQEMKPARGERIYSGLAKVKELRHDTALYRVYQKKAAEIASKGGSIRRVILDYELKRDLYRDIAERLSEAAKAKREGQGQSASMKEIKEEVAARHGLNVVESQIEIPDLRVEYEDANGEMGRVDLEYMTDSYRPGEIAAKAQAGFSLYAAADQTAKFRKVLDQQRIIGEVLSL
jgi:predicted kinase